MQRLYEFFLILIVGGFVYMIIGNKTIESNNSSDIPEIPLEDFFKNPDMTSFKLSPDGNYISYMKPWENRMNIYVKEFLGEKEVKLTSSTERDIYGYFWLNNNRIGYAKDKGGDENIHIYGVNIDGTNEIDLTPYENIQARLIDDLEDDPDFILIGLNKRDPRVHDVYKLNVNTAEIILLAENPGNISGWMTDHDGKLRIAITSDGVNNSLLYREKESEDFKSILTTNFKESVSPLFFTFDNENLYVSSNRGRDKSAIFKFDLKNAKETDLIFEHNEVDVSSLMSSKKRKIITGVGYYTDKRSYHFFDDWRKNIQDDLEKKLPNIEVVISDLSKDETKALVRTYSDKTRGAYYYYDIKEAKLQKLTDISPWLNEDHMSDMLPIKYTARDGLTIHGYLTLPKGKDHKNLPVIINPHGGPWARDYWGFNPEIQYFANKGYAVFQMNFRGSVGYGRDFWECSFKEWGKSMQDDITDGVNWLIEQGIADKDKIAIYGASYGGYATLAGLAFTPDLYACGVDYVGVSNIFTLLETLPPYWELGRQMMYEMIGNPDTEKELLTAASPLFHVDKIKAPLFIAQGANDPRVKKSESDQIVEALKERGIDVPYLVKDNEGHGFANEENRFEFYRKMGDFLDLHLMN